MIILTMLGTNNYGEVAYEWEQRRATPYPFVQQALAEWFPEAQMLVCVTKEAKEKHGQVLLEAIPQARLVDIPSGKNEGEYWEMFGIIQREIPSRAELVLDITHGFRSLPVLALLTVSFLRAAEQVQLRHVLYGAYEAKSDHSAPMFDLTPFVTMLDWANATNRFLETGDARRFKQLLAKSGEQGLKALGSELEKFTNSLLLNRTTEVSQTAKELAKTIESAKASDYAPQYKPLQLLEHRLIRAISPIADENPIRSQFAQIVWYTRQQQHAQAIALAREWMISVRIWKTDGRFSVNKDERRLAEEWLSTFAKILEHKTDAEKKAEEQGDTAKKEKEKQKRLEAIPAEWLEFITLWQKVSDQRNDYAHFGMRKQTTTVETTLKKARTLPDDLKNAVQSLGLELPEPQ